MPNEAPQHIEVAAVDEGTRLLLPAFASHEDGDAPRDDSSDSAEVRTQAARILLSTTLTRLGSRMWEFAAPLLLLEWSPGSLAAPAALGLACSLSRAVVSPWLGGKADDWDRMTAVMMGTGMQALGCLASVGALAIWNALSSSSSSEQSEERSTSTAARMLSLALVLVAGVVEALGAQLASVAVKKEWVPIVFADADRNDAEDRSKEDDERRGCIPFLRLSDISLSFMNTTMTNIDLLAAMFGPIVAGWVLQIFGGGGDGSYSMQRGFEVIALVNAISFLPEIILLRKVYNTCSGLRQQRGGGSASEKRKQDADQSHRQRDNESNAWSVWFHHPSGLQLLTISLASLYLTALSPSGVVLTAFLVSIGMSPTALGMFRAAGALSGVFGISLFSIAQKWGVVGKEESAAERSAYAGSIERLRRTSMAFLSSEVISILGAAMAYSLCDTSELLGETAEDTRLPWQVILFLGAIVASRAGLYSFDVGALEIEQYLVDERHRNAVGSVEGALCSLAEMGMYVLSIALPDPSNFGWQVGVSATAVSFGGLCFGSFLCMYHMHRHGHHSHHHHGLEGEHKDDDGHYHSHSHSHHHAHTWQQERDLQEFGYHIHLHRRD